MATVLLIALVVAVISLLVVNREQRKTIDDYQKGTSNRKPAIKVTRGRNVRTASKTK